MRLVHLCRYSYLLTCTLSSLLCSLLIGVYLTLKAFALMRAGKLLGRATNLLMTHGALYGSYVDKEELVEGGDVCPICQVGGPCAGREYCCL